MEEQRKAVRAMQVYIREHITEDITPADLAKASNFSPWYARKLFNGIWECGWLSARIQT